MTSSSRRTRSKASGKNLKEENPYSESESDVSDADDHEENTKKFVPFPVSSTSALVKRLNSVHQILKKMKQKPLGQDNPYLNALSVELLKPQLIQSRDKTTRRIVGCCLADIIHIFAPEAPYNDAELKLIFDFFIQQLSGLSEKGAAHFKYSAYILKKLTICNSTVILTQLDDEGSDEYTSEELICKLINALLETLASWHSQEIEMQVFEMISSLLEEMDKIRPKLLEVFLGFLLPENAKHSGRAHQVVRKIILRCSDRLREPISTFVSSLITSEKVMLTEEEEEAAMTDLHEDVYKIIYELHAIQPSLLLYILPRFVAQLTIDDLETRAKAIDLLGNIFSNSTADYIQENEKVWLAFLQRVHDVDPKIRISIVQFCGYVLQHVDRDYLDALAHYFLEKDFNALLHTKSEEVSGRVTFVEFALGDREYSVRKETVDILCEFIVHPSNLKYLNLQILKALAKRVNDKKVEIACEIIEALGTALDVHLIAPYWFNDEKNDAIEELLEWVPEVIFSSLFEARPQHELVHISWLRVRVCDEIILGKGKKRTGPIRARIFAKIWNLLGIELNVLPATKFSIGETGQKALLKLLVEERKILQNQFHNLIDLRNEAHAAESSEEITKKAYGLLHNISRVVPAHVVKGSVQEALKKLWEHRDRNVFRDIAVLCDESTGREYIKKAFEDMSGRLGSKSQAMFAFSVIVHRMAMNTISSSEIPHLIHELFESNSPEIEFHENASNLATFLSNIIKTFPSILKGSAEDTFVSTRNILKQIPLTKARSKIHDPLEESIILCTTGCNLIQTCFSSCTEDANELEICSEISRLLEELFMNGSIPQLSKSCLLTWIKLNNTPEKLKNVAHNIFDSNRIAHSNPLLENTLSGMVVLLKNCPELFTSLADEDETEFIDTSRAIKFAFNFVKHSYEYILAKEEYSKCHSKDRNKALRLKLLCIKIITFEVIRRIDPNKVASVEVYRMLRIQQAQSVSIRPSKITVKRMILLLRKLVQDYGNPWLGETERENQEKGRHEKRPWPPEESEDFSHLRLQAAISLLKLQSACNGTDANRMLQEGDSVHSCSLRNIQRWLELSCISFDPSFEIREKFIAKLFKYILKQGRQWLQYGALIVMANSVKESKQKPRSFSILMEVLRRLQRKCDIDMRKGTNYYAAFAPEAMLPYVIYLIAHHPALPREREELFSFILSPQGKRLVTKPIMVLLDALTGITKGRESNAGLLYSLIDKIRISTDAFDPECTTIHTISEVARLAIKSRLKVSPDSINYPGNLRLPAILYRISSTTSSEDIDREGPLSAISPIPKSKSPGMHVKTPKWKESSNTCLPVGFELGIAHGPTRAKRLHNSSHKKKRKSKSPSIHENHMLSEKKRKVDKTAATRQQPTRTSKRKSSDFKGYQEIDSDVDDSERADENSRTKANQTSVDQNGYVSGHEGDHA